MSNFVYLANGDFLNINTRNKIEQFTNVSTMTPPMMTDNIMTPPIMTDTIMTPPMMTDNIIPPPMMTDNIMPPPMMTDNIMPPPMMTDNIMMQNNPMTPEQIRLQQTLDASRTMNFELQNNIQNVNEAADKLLIELLKR